MYTIITLALLVLVFQHTLAQKGLASNVSSLCTNGCDWTNPAIWSDGIVPISTDTVDIDVGGTYLIQISTVVSVSDFDIGDNSDPDGTQTFQVVSGGSFTSTGGCDAALDVNIVVSAGGSFSVSGQATVRGTLIVAGYAFFGGSNPSLLLDAYNLQNPLEYVNPKLELQNGVVVVTNEVEISIASSITGNGNINGTLDAEGSVKPGLSGIGSLYIYGDFICGSGTVINFEVASETSYDFIFVSQTSHETGFVTVTTLGDYTPLSHSIFYVFNHSSQRGGFISVKGTSLDSLFNNKWSDVVDQSYTAILYDSASSLLISFATIAACLFITLM